MTDEPTHSFTAILRMPRILIGIGLFATATGVAELAAQLWIEVAPFALGGLMLVGGVWLAVLVLRTVEKSHDVENLSRVDRLLIKWSGPLSLLVLIITPPIAFHFIDDYGGVNVFRSSWSLALVATLLALGFVFTICCLTARPGMHVPPRFAWKVLCLPLMFIFGAYALLMPIGCSAERMRAWHDHLTPAPAAEIAPLSSP